jgi:hypothetical protein
MRGVGLRAGGFAGFLALALPTVRGAEWRRAFRAAGMAFLLVLGRDYHASFDTAQCRVAARGESR